MEYSSFYKAGGSATNRGGSQMYKTIEDVAAELDWTAAELRDMVVAQGYAATCALSDDEWIELLSDIQNGN